MSQANGANKEDAKLAELLARGDRPAKPPGPPEVTGDALLAARLEYFGVPMPPCYPVYDRLFVWPLDDMSEAKVRGLYVPEQLKGTYGASRGLLIAGGMKALDQLYSHGLGLGHIVWYARLSPWARKYIDVSGQHIAHVIVLRASEIVGSEDLLAELGGEGLEIGRDTEGTHYIVDKETKQKNRERLDPEDSIDGS